LDFLKEMNRREWSQPVVMCSGTKELNFVYKCLQEGAVDFLLKPITMNSLSTIWRNIWVKNNERALRAHVQTEQAELRGEIATLESHLAGAVITPIKAISDTINQLINDGNLNDATKEALGSVIKTLHQTNLMRGAVESFVLSSDETLDEQTRGWLKSELKLTGPQKAEEPGSRPSHTPIKTLDSATTADLRSFNFDVWTIPDNETFFSMLVAMFNDFGLFETFNVNRAKFCEFLEETRLNYHDGNSYHNWRHAFDVTHMIYLILTSAKGCDFLGTSLVPCPLFSILLSSLVVLETCHSVSEFHFSMIW